MHKTKYRKTKRARPPGVKSDPREKENRNSRKKVITNSTKPLCRPRGHLSWQSHEGLCHCKIHQKSYRKRNEGWGQIWPRVAVWGLINIFRAIYGTLNFVIVFTKATLSWFRRIQSTLSHPITLRSTLILSSHLRLFLTSSLLPAT